MMRSAGWLTGFSLAFALAAPLWAADPANPRLSREARRVLDYLENVYQQKVLSGYNVYVHTPDDYQQTARQAVIWGRDIRWLDNLDEVAAHARRHGYLLTLHWHWFFGGDSAWTKRRKAPVDVGRVVTPGTPEHATAMKELAAAADKLEALRDAGVPVLWRPLHEIDGGWFWWTDRDRPENTAQLWRMMFDYFTGPRRLDNLIWVYSAGVGSRDKKPVSHRRRFYPGPEYVDISGIDIYGVDVEKDTKTYRDYFDVMSQVSPGKMLACSECDAIPNPDRMQRGETPRWLYAMPWWGCPSPRRSVRWAAYTMSHELIVTLDEAPALWGGGLEPQVGLLAPADDGSARFPEGPVTLRAYAVDRDGRIERVEFRAGRRVLGAVAAPPYAWTWEKPTPGCYDLTAVAVDNEGNRTVSNRVRALVGVKDLALGRPATASSGGSAQLAVDGDYYTCWVPDRKADDEWIYVDLGAVREIAQVNLLWGWKIHPSRYTIDVAVENPGSPRSWRTVYAGEHPDWVTWKATYRVRFAPTRARYVRLHALERAGRQTWGAYQLAALEVPVPTR